MNGGSLLFLIVNLREKGGNSVQFYNILGSLQRNIPPIAADLMAEFPGWGGFEGFSPFMSPDPETIVRSKVYIYLCIPKYIYIYLPKYIYIYVYLHIFMDLLY